MRNHRYILLDQLLHQFAKRCGGYDRKNRFFHEDLRDAGYLTMPVPHEFGGTGFTSIDR